MKERPILFSGAMVRAILDGRKTQTRRIVKPQPSYSCIAVDHVGFGDFVEVYQSPSRPSGIHGPAAMRCKHGEPGDRLWVRETFANEVQVEHDQPPPHNDGRPVWYDEEGLWHQAHYRATDPAADLMYEDHPRDEPHCRWTPSIHMQRKASRITLEITGVHVERLNDISEADAMAEGMALFNGTVYAPHEPEGKNAYSNARGAFGSLWESINGAGSWDANPWVWVIEFRRV